MLLSFWFMFLALFSLMKSYWWARSRGPFILRALWVPQDRPLGFLFQAPHRAFKLSNLDSRGLSFLAEAFKSDHSALPLNRLVNTEWPNAAGLCLHFCNMLPFNGSIFEQQTAFHRGVCGMFWVMHLFVCWNNTDFLFLVATVFARSKLSNCVSVFHVEFSAAQVTMQLKQLHYAWPLGPFWNSPRDGVKKCSEPHMLIKISFYCSRYQWGSTFVRIEFPVFRRQYSL